MRIFIFCFSLLYSGFSKGQDFPFEFWHDGKIILETGDTLRGIVKYDLQNDLVQYLLDGVIQTYTARKVLMLDIFDVTVKRYRQFFSLPYASTTGEYKTLIFFELLEEGKLTVLCRERLEYTTNSTFYNYGGGYSRLLMVYKYFIMDERGDIVEFKGKKSDWLVMMGKHEKEVQKYAKANRLDFDDKYDLSRILDYYNSFFEKK